MSPLAARSVRGARATIVALALFALVGVVVTTGAFSLAHSHAAFTSADRIGDNVGATTAMQFDSYGRLAFHFRKTMVDCPHQDSRTAVILALGQSNAGNHAARKSASAYGDKVVNFFHGRCAIAQSPLLGASGDGGEQWTALANELVARGLYERVVIVPAAIAGSTAGQWSNGNLTAVLDDVIDSLHGAYVPTAILWHQGEADLWAGTSQYRYQADMRSIVGHIRASGLPAPFYVAVASRCTDHFVKWGPENPIAHAQRGLADAMLDIQVGADADRLLQGRDRYDDCHLSETGVAKMARAWTAALDHRAVSR
jgi:hypothetical protein